MTTRRGFLGALAAVAVVRPAPAPYVGPWNVRPVGIAGITDGGTLATGASFDAALRAVYSREYFEAALAETEAKDPASAWWLR